MPGVWSRCRGVTLMVPKQSDVVRRMLDNQPKAVMVVSFGLSPRAQTAENGNDLYSQPFNQLKIEKGLVLKGFYSARVCQSLLRISVRYLVFSHQVYGLSGPSS